MTAFELLQAIALGVSSWTLLKVIKQGEKIVRIETKLDGLPCVKCSKQT